MAAEKPLGTVYQRAVERLGAKGAGGAIRSWFDGIVPVQVVSRSHSDVAEPLWGIRGFGGAVAGELVSASLTADRDLEIHSWACGYYNLSDAEASGASYPSFQVFTPAASYLPFANPPIFSPGGPPAPGVVAYVAGVRPQRDFSRGTGIMVVGSTALFPPITGPRYKQRLVPVDLSSTNPGPSTDYVVFDPPLIVPAFTFLTAQAVLTQVAPLGSQFGIDWSVWYRELPS